MKKALRELKQLWKDLVAWFPATSPRMRRLAAAIAALQQECRKA